MQNGKPYIEIFDSTLRDGAQGEGVSLTLDDKIAIVRALDRLGIPYIEAGHPGATRREAEFFRQMRNVKLEQAKLVAFGSTRRSGTRCEEDAGCAALAQAGTAVVSLFGKSSALHVEKVLGTSLEENLQMISETVAYFKAMGKSVFYDAEHFFDGYKENPEYALQTLAAAQNAGADRLVLCDTNGGMFPDEIAQIVRVVAERFPQAVLGIHCHNDTECAVANSLLAVEAGVRHVQGTFLGFGERCGNAALSSILPDLQLKRNYYCIPEEAMAHLTPTARYLAEISNMRLRAGMPFVGRSAFGHKAGMHMDGVQKISVSFEHISPDSVGNERRFLYSEYGGRSAAARALSRIDPTITRDDPRAAEFAQWLKLREEEGYQFETADASLYLLAWKFLGLYHPMFEIIHFRVIGEGPLHEGMSAAATIKIRVGEGEEITAAEGDGPVHALDCALRKALGVFYPCIQSMWLIDYKVRVIESHSATASKVRVFIESTDGRNTWTTVGLSSDIIEASRQALCDSVEYRLIMEQLKNVKI